MAAFGWKSSWDESRLARYRLVVFVNFRCSLRRIRKDSIRRTDNAKLPKVIPLSRKLQGVHETCDAETSSLMFRRAVDSAGAPIYVAFGNDEVQRYVPRA